MLVSYKITKYLNSQNYKAKAYAPYKDIQGYYVLDIHCLA
jgi:hypothetical protein